MTAAPPKLRFRTITLGCKVNQYETEWVRTSLLLSGGEEAQNPADADLVIVNTCSVTAESDAKSRKIAAGAAADSPNAEIIVMGCFASSHPDQARSLPQVSEILTDKRELNSFLTRRGWVVPEGIDAFGKRHRAYIKIQDGCRVGCAYCIIPSVRPYLASRREEEVICEARRLAENGFREIVLTGIHLGHYGLDLIAKEKGEHPQVLAEFLEKRQETEKSRRHSLASLLERLAQAKIPARFRLGSLEAVEVSDELLETIARYPDQLCPHFHLSMQSGDDAVLKRMKRRWPSGPYLAKCQEILERIPRAALTTDVIVGFPGETDAEFKNTCDLVEKIGFSKVHIFRYSRRPGTEADRMPNQIPEPVKKERVAHLTKIAQTLRESYARSLVGEETKVLIEDIIEKESPEKSGEKTTVYRGTNEFYLPVEMKAMSQKGDCEKEKSAICPQRSLGQIFTGRIKSVSGDLLLVE